jgi:hypothetical protein
MIKNITGKNIFFFFSIIILLFSFHIFPTLIIGNPVVYISDNLNCFVPFNYIAGQMISGNFEAHKLLMNGELPWQFIYHIFFPLNISYAIFEIETAYIVNDIIVRSISFFSCLYFLKKFHSPSFLKILISILFSSGEIFTSWGIGVAAFPYILSLCVKKDISKKNYFFLIFIALNTDLYLHGIYIPFLIATLVFFLRKQFIINLKKLFKIFLIFFVSIIVSNSNLIYSIYFFSPFQISETQNYGLNVIDNIKILFFDIFSLYPINNNFYNNYILIFLYNLTIIISIYKKIKLNFFLLFFIIFLSAVSFAYNLHFDTQNNHSSLKNSVFLTRYTYFFLFIKIFFIFNALRFFELNKLSIIILTLSILYNQITPTLFTVVKNKLLYSEFTKDQKEILKNNYYNNDFFKFSKNIYKFYVIKKEKKENKLVNKKNLVNSYYASTIKDYYIFDDYKFIKKIIDTNKTISIGYDPMIAIVNNINVVDGYYRYYPLKYKKKFYEIIKYQATPQKLSEIFNRSQYLLSYVNENEEIKLNFDQLKNMDVKFIISKFHLTNKNLILVCMNCNGNNELFLYKII